MDEDAANAARASFLKKEEGMTEGNKRLIKYLAKHGHTSPFRHTSITFEIKAPIMVARQWFKYRIGSEHGPDFAELLGVSVPEEWREEFYDYTSKVLGFVGQGDDGGFGSTSYGRNEASRRYVTSEPEFYSPTVWRSAPENKKQGSGAEVPMHLAATADQELFFIQESGVGLYHWAILNGICAEQARLFLPMYGLYTTWWWTGSSQAVAHFIDQRLGEDAQGEIQEYAAATYALVMPYFTHSIQRLVEETPKPPTLEELIES